MFTLKPVADLIEEDFYVEELPHIHIRRKIGGVNVLTVVRDGAITVTVVAERANPAGVFYIHNEVYTQGMYDRGYQATRAVRYRDHQNGYVGFYTEGAGDVRSPSGMIEVMELAGFQLRQLKW